MPRSELSIAIGERGLQGVMVALSPSRDVATIPFVKDVCERFVATLFLCCKISPAACQNRAISYGERSQNSAKEYTPPPPSLV